MKNILISGYGWTGSTALYDMFKEYQGICVLPHEFDDFRGQNAIGDIVEKKLKNSENIDIGKSSRSGNILYILQFLVRGIVPNILWPKRLKGYSVSREYSLDLGIKLLKERWSYNKYTKKIVSSSSKDAISLAKEWIEEVINIHNQDSLQYIVFDQPIIYDKHYDIWTKIFDDAKLILVCRNPLDQMGSILRDAPHFLRPVPWKVEVLYGRDSFQNRPLMFFMDTTKNRYKLISDTYRKLGQDKMLVVQFENLVNNYEETKKKIELFTGIDSKKHIEKLKYFDFNKSKLNLNARSALCTKTLEKAMEIEPFYKKMIEEVRAI